MKITKGRWVAFCRDYKIFFEHTRGVHLQANAEGRGRRGHGRDHDLMVAGYCMLINRGRDGTLAALAALMHSFDRLYKKKNGRGLKKALADARDLLPPTVTASERDQILQAVREHSGKNLPDDGMVKKILMDADRLASAGAAVIVRSGQFYPDIPVAELQYLRIKNPLSTYTKPCSNLDDLRESLEYESHPDFGLRLDEARKIGKRIFKFLRLFIEQLVWECEVIGLADLPAGVC